ncbi:MAG: MBL fold metallo-hydrolase [Bacilli bacterium]|nr:MBL fold metallo-hydrolase [Bacilli bacterium]
MKFKTLASGSKGNSSVVMCGDIKLLIDAGISFLSLKEKLKKDNISIEDITAILITHSHQDHIKGLASLIKNTSLKVLIPEKMYDELSNIVPPNKVVYLKEKNKIKNVEIELIHTSHDVACSVGYIITYENKSLVYITDTGYLNRKVLKKITNKSLYLIESNHDEEMLMNGPYPPFLKQRVISDYGHLSNRTTASYLKEVTGDATKYVILAHLSEKNNTEELAYSTTSEALKNKEIDISIARQSEESKLIEV